MNIKRTGYLGMKVGLVLGLIYSFGGLAIDTLVSLGYLDADDMGTPGLSYGTILAFGALLGMPLIFGGLGVLLGAVIAAFRWIIANI